MSTNRANVIIRADANIRLGTGHIMRCIALAQAWQDHGGDATFLSHCNSETLRQRIINQGFEFIPIGKPYPEIFDLVHTLEILEKFKIQNSKFKTWVILDGYHFSSDYQLQIKEAGHRLLLIDDMAHQPKYNVDILLNQNIHASSLTYFCDMDTVKLLGCEYVLLRREFLKYKDWEQDISDKAKKILVTMGGSDPDNVTLKIIKALNRLGDSDLELKIIAGPVNTNINSLEKELHLSSFTFQLLTNVSNMPSIMAWADMAVSAGGSTCWELMFVGVPILVIILSENQVVIANGLGKAGAAVNCGWHYKLTEEGFLEIFVDLIKNRKRRMALSRKAQQMVDGLGSERVMKRMRSHLE
jgi:UDP-2,4-diacetamido-2,4,6-trideoxy-beta-L-altropyranose hydrolase